MFERSLADYNRAIELDPDVAIFYCNRGLSYYYLEDSAKAISNFTRAIKLDPTFAEAYSGRGEAYASLGKYKKALADFDRSLELDPGNIDAYASRTLTLSLQDAEKQASSPGIEELE